MAEIHLSPKQVALLAFGSHGAVARACGVYHTVPSRWEGIPSHFVDRLCAVPEAPRWLTREMLIGGATVRLLGAVREAA